LAKSGWVCGIDAGSFRTLSYVAWLRGTSFLLDMYSPTLSQLLPELPSLVENVGSYAIDAPQSLPKVGHKRRQCDMLAQTPTRVLPENLQGLEDWRLYKGLIELGIQTFWHIYRSGEIRIFGLDDTPELPLVAETYPRKVAEDLGLGRLPSKRNEPMRYVEHIWSFLQSQGFRCESVIRPSVDQVDAMLCAIAAQSIGADSNASEPLGNKPYVDKEASVLREGFIVVPSRVKG